MLSLPDLARLKDLHTDQIVESSIVPLSKGLAKQVDSQWWKIGGSRTARENEADHGWRWSDIAGSCRLDPWCECRAIVTPDGVVQGAINYHLNGKSLREHDLGAVFVHHLATAPRNRPWLVPKPRYKGVGLALLSTAIVHGYVLGLGGRVVVPSVPTERTRQFYEKRGFQYVSEDDDGIIDFELTPEAAQAWLLKEGFLE
jgi:hypothetical protein